MEHTYRLRYEQRPDGGLREIPPARCPEGHELRPGTVLTGPGQRRHWWCLACEQPIWEGTHDSYDSGVP